jgi:AcrR family transcriptional regulator
MANTLKFDRDEVLEKACAVFWKKGFHATSTRDIQDAVNLRPGSLYATFGSKQDLYGATLTSYTHAMIAKLYAHQSPNKPILQGLEDFVRSVIFDHNQDTPSRMCMLAKANMEFTTDDPALQKLALDLFDTFEGELCKIFADAQKKAELPSELKPIDYARNFQIQFTGLRSYVARLKDDTQADLLINQLFASIKKL